MGDAFYHIDLHYLEQMACGDAEVKKQMLEMVLNQLPAEFSDLGRALSGRIPASVAASAHRLKSTLAFTGNAQLIGWSRELEELARTEAEVSPKMHTLYESLSLGLPRVMEEIKIARTHLEL